jgi:hypothetical protein
MRNNILLWVVTVMVTLPLSAQNLENIDEIAPFSEGLAAVRKGNQWGFINEEGKMVIDYRTDVYWNKNADASRSDVLAIHYPTFNEGLCLIIQTVEDGVPVFGFMDTKGAIVIEPQFLNIYPFQNGYTTGVLIDKTIKGENEFKLKIYAYKFFDVRLTTSGEITDYFEKRDHILMTVRRYTTPDIGAKLLKEGLVAVHIPEKGWQIKNLQ